MNYRNPSWIVFFITILLLRWGVGTTFATIWIITSRENIFQNDFFKYNLLYPHFIINMFVVIFCLVIVKNIADLYLGYMTDRKSVFSKIKACIIFIIIECLYVIYLIYSIERLKSDRIIKIYISQIRFYLYSCSLLNYVLIGILSFLHPDIVGLKRRMLISRIQRNKRHTVLEV